jgi:hypothetical protein
MGSAIKLYLQWNPERRVRRIVDLGLL